MTRKYRKSLYLMFLMAIISAFILSSCASKVESQNLDLEQQITQIMQVEENEAAPEESAPASTEETVSFISGEQARDFAIAHLMEKYSLEAPGVWTAQDQTPENLVGSTISLYSSGAWSVIVKAPVVSPEYIVYIVEISHVSSGLHWEGEVTASGELHEIALADPLKVLSPKEALDTAVAYITSNYGWDTPDAFVEQSSQPTDRAGIRRTYTAGPWAIQIEYLASTPIVREYWVTADHLNRVARWVGVVNADGVITGEQYIVE